MQYYVVLVLGVFAFVALFGLAWRGLPELRAGPGGSAGASSASCPRVAAPAGMEDATNRSSRRGGEGLKGRESCATRYDWYARTTHTKYVYYTLKIRPL